MYITQALKRAVQINRHGITTIDGTRQRSWAGFAERVAKLAGVFHGLDLRAGGRVAILALNQDRYLEYFFAVLWAGGILVPLNIRLSPRELCYMLNDAGAEILLVDDTFQSVLPAFSGKLTTVKHVVFAGAGPVPQGSVDYEESLAKTQALRDVERGGDHVAGIFYTGGTTGLAKGVMLTHDNIVSNALSLLASLATAGKGWIYLHAAPMFHIAGCSTSCSLTLLACTHVFIPKFEVAAMLNTIQEHRVTHTFLAPTMINMLASFPGVETYDLSSLRTIFYGASPMPEAVLRKAMQVLPACEFIQGYGMTETSPLITMLAGEYHTFAGPCAGKTASAGQAAPGIEVKIVDGEGHEVPSGTIGEIITRGPHVMHGYWNKPAETAQALRGGWMYTGDAGYMDDEGFVYVVDRVKDMIITGGENVYSVEVENAIYQHPSVAMCAVIGIPSEEWGEAIHAVVFCKEGCSVSVAELIAHCKERLVGYKCPRTVDIRQAPLPLSGAGKILKTELRAPFWVGKTRRVS
ncbi:MAG: acyl-CoA synthetase [Gammaproteobacteria bacterium]